MHSLPAGGRARPLGAHYARHALQRHAPPRRRPAAADAQRAGGAPGAGARERHTADRTARDGQNRRRTARLGGLARSGGGVLFGGGGCLSCGSRQQPGFLRNVDDG